MTIIFIDENHINVSGHSGYDEFGHDICCAGISSLTWALKMWCEDNAHLATECRVSVSEGSVDIVFVPLEQYENIWNQIRNAFKNGYLAMYEEFPSHICVEY